MKTATVEELRDPDSGVWDAIEAGETFAVTKDGQILAHLLPATEVPGGEQAAAEDRVVDWSMSRALTRDRSGDRVLTAEESAAILDENKGSW